MRVLGLCLVAVLLSSWGCRCGRPTDEERLREQLDVTAVHIYLATKVAVTGAQADAQAQVARKHLLDLIGVTLKATNQLLADPQRPHDPLSAISAGDALLAGQALWELRGAGKRVLKEGRKSALPPLLPSLLGSLPPPLSDAARMPWTPEQDHAFLLAAFFVLKTHPKSPVPLPEEMPLYEAWMTDAEALRALGMADVLHGVKAFLFGTNTYCDLARDEAAQVGIKGTPAEALGRIVAGVGEKEAREVAEASGALAHGAAAYCYLSRSQDKEGRAELRRFTESAERTGLLSAEDLALLRAYLSFREGDMAAVRNQLVVLRDSPRLSEERRREIAEAVTYLDKNNASAAGRLFGKVFLLQLCARIAWAELTRLGVLDQLARSPRFQSISALSVSSARIGEALKLPSVDSARQRGRDLVDGLRGKLHR